MCKDILLHPNAANILRIRARFVLKRSRETSHEHNLHNANNLDFHHKFLGSEFESMKLCYLYALFLGIPTVLVDQCFLSETMKGITKIARFKNRASQYKGTGWKDR